MTDLKTQLAPGWSPVNIGIIVVLALTIWPLALAMVAYVVWGARVGLDLSQPRTIGTFARRLGTAWKAAVHSFKANQ